MTSVIKGAKFARMITSYILILCASTWLLVGGLCQSAKRVATLLGPSALVSPSWCVVAPIIAFLTVVAAAPAMLVAAIMLLVAQITASDRARGPLIRFGVAIFAALLTASSLDFPEIARVPSAAMLIAAAMLLLVMILVAARLPTQIGSTVMATMTALLPLLASPLVGAPCYIALDVALIVSGLLAALMALPHHTLFAAARGPLTIITGWLILESAAHGAWVPAALSIATFGITIAYGLIRMPEPSRYHAL